MTKGLIKFIGGFLVLIGVIILISSIMHSVSVITTMSYGNKIKGVVTNERLVINNETEHYVYSISFVSDSLTYTVKTKNNSSSKKYKIGENVQLYVDENSPYNAVIDNDDEKYRGQIIRYSLSFIFLIFGIILMFKSNTVYVVIKGFKEEEL